MIVQLFLIHLLTEKFDFEGAEQFPRDRGGICNPNFGKFQSCFLVG